MKSLHILAQNENFECLLQPMIFFLSFQLLCFDFNNFSMADIIIYEF